MTTATFTLSVSYNTSLNSRSPKSFKADIYPTQPGDTDTLSALAPSDGPVENNVARYYGVFATYAEAVSALAEFVAVSVPAFTISRRTNNWTESDSIIIGSVDVKNSVEDQFTVKVLHRRHPHGAWTSEAVA